MSDYEVNPLIRAMEKYSEADDKDIWGQYKVAFAKLPLEKRLEDLRVVDGWLDDQHGATREHASLLSARRELSDLHRFLKAGNR